MNASDLIEDLQGLIDQHGDLEVVMADDSTPAVEFNDDDEDEDPVFVIA